MLLDIYPNRMEKKLTCAIVDDDASIVRILEAWLSKMPDVEVKGTFSDSLSVMQFLSQQSVDFLLLDVEMGETNGFEMLNNIASAPHVIIITSHRDYALQGYDYNVVDYIVKPVSPERLHRAISRLRTLKSGEQVSVASTSASNTATPTITPDANECLMVKENRRMVRIGFDEILYVEAARDYCKIVTTERQISTKCSIGDMATDLPNDRFIRIHRSFVVAIRRINAFGHDGVEIGAHKIPFGRLYREDALIALEKFFGVKK